MRFNFQLQSRMHLVHTPFVALFVLAMSIAVAAQSSTRYTSFREGANKTGAVIGTRVAPPLRERWSVPLPAPYYNGSQPSYPVIADGRVFLTYPTPESYSGFHLIAFDAATGVVLWGPVAVPSQRPGCSVCYDRGVVVTLDQEGTVRGFDADSGRERWSRHLGSEYIVSSSPTVYDGIAYVVGGSAVWAVRTSNGELVWESENGGSNTSPVVTKDSIYSVRACYETQKVRRSNGKTEWNVVFECTGGGGSTAALFENRLYVRDAHDSHETDLVLDPAGGAVVGMHPGGYTPAFAEGRGYYVSAEGLLQAVDTETNRVLWSFTGDGHITTAAHVVDGFVYVGSQYGEVWALDREGVVVWSTNLGSAVQGHFGPESTYTDMSAWDGLLVVVTASRLVALESVTAPPVLDVFVQDDASANWLAFNGTTGEFQFGECGSGVTATGTGVVTRMGANKLRLIATGNVVVDAIVNTSKRKAKATVSVGESGRSWILKDKNTRDSSVQCP